MKLVLKKVKAVYGFRGKPKGRPTDDIIKAAEILSASSTFVREASG